MTKTNLGRPRLQTTRSTTIEFRLSDLEKQAFGEAASNAGVGLSTWVRERLRGIAIQELAQVGKRAAFLTPITLAR